MNKVNPKRGRPPLKPEDRFNQTIIVKVKNDVYERFLVKCQDRLVSVVIRELIDNFIGAK